MSFIKFSNLCWKVLLQTTKVKLIYWYIFIFLKNYLFQETNLLFVKQFVFCTIYKHELKKQFNVLIH